MNDTEKLKLIDEFKSLKMLNGQEADGFLKDGTWLSDWILEKIQEREAATIEAVKEAGDFDLDNENARKIMGELSDREMQALSIGRLQRSEEILAILKK